MKGSDDLGDTVTRELYLFVTLHFVHFDHLAFGLTSSAQLLFSSKVALLSARIQEITAPDKAIAERNKDPDAPLEDDALKPHIDRREDAANASDYSARSIRTKYSNNIRSWLESLRHACVEIPMEMN